MEFALQRMFTQRRLCERIVESQLLESVEEATKRLAKCAVGGQVDDRVECGRRLRQHGHNLCFVMCNRK